MAEFVVAYLSMFEGEIEMTRVSAKDEIEAVVSVVELDPKVFNTLEVIYQYCTDTDAYVAVHQI
jgi:hypothetical protein